MLWPAGLRILKTGSSLHGGSSFFRTFLSWPSPGLPLAPIPSAPPPQTPWIRLGTSECGKVFQCFKSNLVRTPSDLSCLLKCEANQHMVGQGVDGFDVHNAARVGHHVIVILYI